MNDKIMTPDERVVKMLDCGMHLTSMEEEIIADAIREAEQAAALQAVKDMYLISKSYPGVEIPVQIEEIIKRMEAGTDGC